MELNAEQKAQYLHRSYTAVDGLWFVKIEEEFGFEKALEIDKQVWDVMPKIQARKIKQLTGLSRGLDDLCEALQAKLNMDGFDFTVNKDKHEPSFTVSIKTCPWHEILKNCGRVAKSEKIGSVICNAEFSGWAKEFGDDITYQLCSRICKGDDLCVVKYFQQTD